MENPQSGVKKIEFELPFKKIEFELPFEKIEFELPFDECVLRQLIGKQKEIIQETGISYLRVVPKEKNIEMWGNSSSCYLAKDKIYKLIFNIINKITSNYEYVLSDFTFQWFVEKLKVVRPP